MQRNKHNQILMSASLLGVGTILGFSTVATAAPRNQTRNDVRQERKDVKEARKEVKQERKDVRKADSPAERRDAREDVKDAQRDLRNQRQDVRQERREDNRYDNRGPGNRGYGNQGYNGNAYPGWNQPKNPHYNNGYNPNWNRPNNGYNNGTWNNGNNGYNNGAQSFTGIVTDVQSNQSFNVRIGSSTYNVYLSTVLPRRLSEGDTVRVYGVRVGNNDIRNASVAILGNR